MYSDSGFKYKGRRISEEIGGFNEYPGILQWNNDDSECISCSFCCSYNNRSIYAFFSERRREHYDELNEVFTWLDNLHIDFFDIENPYYVLPRIEVGVGKDSMFYDDATRHMSKKMKQNIENFEKSLNTCNAYIQSSNIAINNLIKEKPAYANLTNEQSSSIYRMTKIAFKQSKTKTKFQIA